MFEVILRTKRVVIGEEVYAVFPQLVDCVPWYNVVGWDYKWLYEVSMVGCEHNKGSCVGSHCREFRARNNR